jgi:hypothetical protein
VDVDIKPTYIRVRFDRPEPTTLELVPKDEKECKSIKISINVTKGCGIISPPGDTESLKPITVGDTRCVQFHFKDVEGYPHDETLTFDVEQGELVSQDGNGQVCFKATELYTDKLIHIVARSFAGFCSVIYDLKIPVVPPPTANSTLTIIRDQPVYSTTENPTKTICADHLVEGEKQNDKIHWTVYRGGCDLTDPICSCADGPCCTYTFDGGPQDDIQGVRFVATTTDPNVRRDDTGAYFPWPSASFQYQTPKGPWAPLTDTVAYECGTDYRLKIQYDIEWPGVTKDYSAEYEWYLFEEPKTFKFEGKCGSIPKENKVANIGNQFIMDASSYDLSSPKCFTIIMYKYFDDKCFCDFCEHYFCLTCGKVEIVEPTVNSTYNVSTVDLHSNVVIQGEPVYYFKTRYIDSIEGTFGDYTTPKNIFSDGRHNLCMELTYKDLVLTDCTTFDVVTVDPYACITGYLGKTADLNEDPVKCYTMPNEFKLSQAEYNATQPNFALDAMLPYTVTPDLDVIWPTGFGTHYKGCPNLAVDAVWNPNCHHYFNNAKNGKTDHTTFQSQMQYLLTTNSHSWTYIKNPTLYFVQDSQYLQGVGGIGVCRYVENTPDGDGAYFDFPRVCDIQAVALYNVPQKLGDFRWLVGISYFNLYDDNLELITTLKIGCSYIETVQYTQEAISFMCLKSKSSTDKVIGAGVRRIGLSSSRWEGALALQIFGNYVGDPVVDFPGFYAEGWNDGEIHIYGTATCRELLSYRFEVSLTGTPDLPPVGTVTSTDGHSIPFTSGTTLLSFDWTFTTPGEQTITALLYAAGVPKSETFTVTVVENSFCGYPPFPMLIFKDQEYDLYPYICPGKTDNFTVKRINYFSSASNADNWYNDDTHHVKVLSEKKWAWRPFFADAFGLCIPDFLTYAKCVTKTNANYKNLATSTTDNAICTSLQARTPTILPATAGGYGFTVTYSTFWQCNWFCFEFDSPVNGTLTKSGVDDTGLAWSETRTIVDGQASFADDSPNVVGQNKKNVTFYKRNSRGITFVFSVPVTVTLFRFEVGPL